MVDMEVGIRGGGGDYGNLSADGCGNQNPRKWSCWVMLDRGRNS